MIRACGIMVAPLFDTVRCVSQVAMPISAIAAVQAMLASREQRRKRALERRAAELAAKRTRSPLGNSDHALVDYY